MEVMNEVVSAYEQDISFTLGFAGSGKSTKLAEEANDTTIVLTPTHKARNVLEAKGVKNVFTIHAVLKLVPTINQNFRKGQKLRKLKRIGGVDLLDIDKVIIDEFSMINVTILDLLLELLPKGAKVSIYGDPYQLSPVDGDPVEPECYTDDISYLTTQHRADNPNVINSFMRFMNYIKDGSVKDLTLNNLPTITERQLAQTFNPKNERIIAYTNQRVIELNSLIKAPELNEGDEILLNGLNATIVAKGHTFGLDYIFPAMISKGQLNFDLLDEIEANLEKYNGWQSVNSYDIVVVNVDGELYNAFYDLEHYYNNKSYEEEVKEAQLHVIEANSLNDDVNLPKWCATNRTGMGVKRRGQAWQCYLSHSSHIFDLRYPYATTVHKAQGQEFDTVYIDQTNMKKAVRNGYVEQYTRLMYVALSRATKRVFIIKD